MALESAFLSLTHSLCYMVLSVNDFQFISTAPLRPWMNEKNISHN